MLKDCFMRENSVLFCKLYHNSKLNKPVPIIKVAKGICCSDNIYRRINLWTELGYIQRLENNRLIRFKLAKLIKFTQKGERIVKELEYLNTLFNKLTIK